MKISTKTRYGLRALVDLAIHSTGEQVPLVNIAERQELSVNYLEQVFSLLKRANIVRSIKGAQGGYILSRRADEITVGEVIRAIEGEILVVDEGDQKNNGSLLSINMQKCLQKEVWDKMTQSISEVVDQITIQDLVNDHAHLKEQDPIMYYI